MKVSKDLKKGKKECILTIKNQPVDILLLILLSNWLLTAPVGSFLIEGRNIGNVGSMNSGDSSPYIQCI